ncbi:Paraplegin [Taenia solium]|eukprot:TsM_000575400 transcript=TsM_000575400 gene=TsM_000575400
MFLPSIRRTFVQLMRSPGRFLTLASNSTGTFHRVYPRQFRLVSTQVRRVGQDSKSSPPKGDEGMNPRRSPKRMFIVPFMAFSAGLSLAIAYYLYRVAKPVEVSWRVFEEFLSRGEVRSIQVSQSRKRALVLLQSAQYVDGSAVFVVSVPLQNETALDFERRVRLFEAKIGIPQSDRIPLTITQEMNTNDLVITVILSSAVAATVALIWIRKNAPHDLPPKEAIMVALRKLSYQNSDVEARTKKGAQRRPPPPRLLKDEPSVGGSYTGGFGSGMPFLDAFPGMGEPQPITTNTTFDDVAGMHAAKEEVMEFVSYLKNPAKYQDLGAKLPKGALLLGPPGTGKTLLVKALAHEAGVPFYSMAGSEFIEIIGGLGASRIRKLFNAARQRSPSIIFIDEIDSVGRKRSASAPGGGGGGVAEMEQTLNQLLVEMDGMDTTEGTIVFAATNRADLLDKALLRAGRFDRHIFIDLPNIAERKELLDMYLGKYKLATSIDVLALRDRLATWTSGMSGADIARLCNEAALITARGVHAEEGIQVADFDSALERVLAGAAKRSSPLSQPERRVAAVQEAGRALVASLLPSTGLTPFRVSIVPRASTGDSGASGSLGFTQFVPEERYLLSCDDIADRLTVLLAGRAAEEFIFKASSDASEQYLKRATDLAYKEVRDWGMSKAVGNLSFGDHSQNPFSVEPYSKRTAALIDFEVQRLVAEAFQRAMALIKRNELKLRRIVDELLEKEVLSADELKAIIALDSAVTSSSSSSTVPAS